MTDEKLDIRWVQRFENYKKALSSLQKIINNRKDGFSEVEEMAIIQAFEFTYELSWKTMKDYIEYQGEIAPYPREAIKKAFERGIISDGQVWMDMLKSRNSTSHLYEENTVKLITYSIVGIYLSQFEKLEKFFADASQ